MNPFEVLGLRPFLLVDATGEAELKKKLIEASRRFHPDLFAQADKSARDEAEATLSKLNRAFGQIRDFWSRVELVAHKSEGGVDNAKLPPALAMEYFELQEAFLEDPRAAQAQQVSFLGRLEDEIKKLEHEAAVVSHPYAYPTQKEISENDKKALASMLSLRRYLTRLQDDLFRLSQQSTKSP